MHLEQIDISAIASDISERSFKSDGMISASLQQHNRFRLCKYAFKLIDRRILSVTVDGLFVRRPDYEIDIGILNPEPKRVLTVNWGYLAAFLILATSAILAARSELFPSALTASSLLAANALVFLLLAAYSCRNRLVFYSRNGWVPLVNLMYRNPSDKMFHMFTNALIAEIRCVHSTYGSRSEMLRTDLREHRRLMERGIISERHYDWIKQYILFLHEKSPKVRLDEYCRRGVRE